jgi:glyoxylase-like metal-dependent hydrolase (beta-lactamase superfamily II)
MRFGDFEIHLLLAGGWRPDGGSLFGVVPKVLWERQKPANERNQVLAACAGVIVKHRGKVIVCETGIGTKLDEKRAQRDGVWEPDGLLTSLKAVGVRPEEVDIVLATHLHWDHAGGFTRRNQRGGVRLTFPKAKHFIQGAEWQFALNPDPRSRAGYIPDDFQPVEEAGLVEFVEGEAEILPGVVLRHTGGHTPGHQFCIFRASQDLACAVTGDVIATRSHLRIPWNSATDLDVLRTLEAKGRLIEEAAAHRWLLVLSHEADQPAGYVAPDGAWTPEPELAPPIPIPSS